MNSTRITFGFGVGNIIAAMLSWKLYHSVGWAFLHFILGWLYVAYYLIVRYV